MEGPAAAVRCLPDFVAVDMSPKPLSELLVEIIISLEWSVETTAEDLAEKWLNRFRVYIQREINKAFEEASFVQFAFNSASKEHIQGSCYAEPRDGEAVRNAKRSRANAFKYREAFSQIKADQFETLCGKIIELLKVETPVVTKASADQGIDFFGQVPYGQLMKPSAINAGAEKQLKIWLVGQAKHYNSTQVSTSDIRELVGSVSLAKSKAYAGANDPLAGLQIRNCDPVFYLFFTTGKISRDAHDLLKKAGVVAMDGMQLAVFLADHDTAIVDGRFDYATFEAWMNS